MPRKTRYTSKKATGDGPSRGRKPYAETAGLTRRRLDQLLAGDGDLVDQRDFLLLAGHLLYGSVWQAEMARLLGKEHKFIARCLMEPKPDARLSTVQREIIQQALAERRNTIDRHLERFTPVVAGDPDQLPPLAAIADDWAA